MNSRSSLLTAYALSAFGGVLMFVGWSGFGVWPIELVALVPFWAALALVAGRSWKCAFTVGWVYGTVAMGGGYHWMLGASLVFSGWAAILNFAFFAVCSIYLGLQYATQGALYWAIRERNWGVPVAALSTFIVAEWLFPKWFPVYMANALLPQPLLVQTADLGGPLLVSVLVGLVNLAAFEALRWWRGARTAPVTVFVGAVTIIGLSLLYGLARIAQLDVQAEAAPSLELGLVQANMSIPERRNDPRETLRRHLEQSRDLEAGGALDLLVWPELAYHPALARKLPFTAKELRSELESPLLFGSYSYADEAGRRKLYNSVFLLHEDGVVREVYDKTHLLVGGEYLPFGETFPAMYALSPNTGRLTAGPDADALLLGPWRISTPICYEDILPGFVRRMVNEAKPHILINLTDDVWLGDAQAAWIHLRLAQFRAIEHRRYLVRATNSGVSAVIDPVGRIRAHTGVDTRENLRAIVHRMEEQTLYARLGDWPGWLSLLVVLSTLVRRRRLRV